MAGTSPRPIWIDSRVKAGTYSPRLARSSSRRSWVASPRRPNVMIAKDGRVEVLDFGLARMGRADDELEIAVDDALVMRGGQRVGERGGRAQQRLDPNTFVADQLVERLPIHELHREEVEAFGLFDRVDGHDARVTSAASAFASRRKRSSRSGLAAISAGRTLSATSRPSRCRWRGRPHPCRRRRSLR